MLHLNCMILQCWMIKSRLFVDVNTVNNIPIITLQKKKKQISTLIKLLITYLINNCIKAKPN